MAQRYMHGICVIDRSGDSCGLRPVQPEPEPEPEAGCVFLGTDWTPAPTTEYAVYDTNLPAWKWLAGEHTYANYPFRMDMVSPAELTADDELSVCFEVLGDPDPVQMGAMYLKLYTSDGNIQVYYHTATNAWDTAAETALADYPPAAKYVVNLQQLLLAIEYDYLLPFDLIAIEFQAGNMVGGPSPNTQRSIYFGAATS